MPNPYFQFKQFTVWQDKCAMKVTTDGCLFGAWAAQKIKNSDIVQKKLSDKHLLDIGTGTGLLPLMLAQKNPEIKIEAIEIDEGACRQARQNILRSPWKNHIRVINADVRLYSFTQQFDIIISNPPFYENEFKAADVKKNLAYHDAGLLLHDLLNIIQKNLKPDGSFFLLLPFKKMPVIKNLLMEHSLHISEIVFVRQSVHHDFFRIMLSGNLMGKKNEETAFEEISIRNGRQKYTLGFIELLKDYYLHL